MSQLDIPSQGQVEMPRRGKASCEKQTNSPRCLFIGCVEAAPTSSQNKQSAWDRGPRGIKSVGFKQQH